jgi:hypothetical protein
MLAVSPSQTGNRLLAALSRADLALLQPHLKHGPLRLRQELEWPNRRIDYVYFPHAGIASVVAVQANDTRVEVGLIGYEGMTGTSILLGSDRTPHSTYIQAAGEGQRIGALKFSPSNGDEQIPAHVVAQVCTSFHGADSTYRHFQCTRQTRCASRPMASDGS